MTTIILINAILGAAALATIASLVAWAIRTQHSDAPVVVPAAGARRQPQVRRRSAAGRQVAQPVA